MPKLYPALLTGPYISFGILATDTWLHTTTSTVSIDQYTLLSDNKFSPGKALNTTWCTSSDKVQTNAPCSLSVAATNTALVGSDEAFKTFANRSSINQISTVEDGARNIVYLGSADLPDNLDYRTTTFAVGTTCSPISRACHLNAAYGASTPFNCSPAYSGDLSLLDPNSLVSPFPVSLTFFQDGALTKGVGYNYSYNRNPIHFGATTILSTAGTTPGRGASSNIANDPDIVVPIHGGLAWILNCTLTIYDFQYTWANNSLISRTLSASNDSMASIFGAAISGTWVGSYFTNAAVIASFQNNANDLAREFATQTSQITAAMSAGIMISHPSDQKQTHNSILVARIPKTPLFTLIGLNILYAFMGLVLALYVLSFSRYNETRDVQTRFSIAGLVAACFEPVHRSQAAAAKVEDLFTERIEGKGFSQKVGIQPSQRGGWQFVSY